MLEDGRLTDSALLPGSAVAGHPVTVSTETVLQSVSAAPGSASGHPITFSGGSIMDSGSIHGHPVVQSPGSAVSGQTMGSYNSLAGGQVQGHAIGFSPTTSQYRASVMGSGTPGSLQGHPVTYSASSLASSQAVPVDRSRAQPRHLAFGEHAPQPQAQVNVATSQQAPHIRDTQSVEPHLQRSLDVYIAEHPERNVQYHAITLSGAPQSPQQLIPGDTLILRLSSASSTATLSVNAQLAAVRAPHGCNNIGRPLRCAGSRHEGTEKAGECSIPILTIHALQVQKF